MSKNGKTPESIIATTPEEIAQIYGVDAGEHAPNSLEKDNPAPKVVKPMGEGALKIVDIDEYGRDFVPNSEIVNLMENVPSDPKAIERAISSSARRRDLFIGKSSSARPSAPTKYSGH